MTPMTHEVLYKFVDREARRDMLPEGARRLVDDPGPHSGPIVGYFKWTHALDESVVGHLVPALLAISRSVVSRTDNGEFRVAMREIEFPPTRTRCSRLMVCQQSAGCLEQSQPEVAAVAECDWPLYGFVEDQTCPLR